MASLCLAGVVFDLDGVLVSTDRYHFFGWKRLADELGMRFREEDNHLLRGVSRHDSLRIIYQLNNRPLPAESEFLQQADRKNGYYVDLISRMTPADVLPGSCRLLEELRACGIRSAVASSSRNAGLVLLRTGLASRLDAVADGNDISRSKPDPEVFLVAARKLGLAPASCVGVEDASAGMLAILAAGMCAVAVGEQADGAAVRVASVADLDAELLRGVLASGGHPGRL